MPGYGLAKKAIEVFERARPSDGLILSEHGIVTFGATAREAYERMIEMVTLAEAFIANRRKTVPAAASAPRKHAELAEIAPLCAASAAAKDNKLEGTWRRLILDFAPPMRRSISSTTAIWRGSASSASDADHTIRTKNWPLRAVAGRAGKLRILRAWRVRRSAVSRCGIMPIQQHNARAAASSMSSIPCPASCLFGLGLFGLGHAKRDAAIAADIARSWVEVVSGAEAIGRFESISEADMFDCGYWPLEQAKLGARRITAGGPGRARHRRCRRDRRSDRQSLHWLAPKSTARRQFRRRERASQGDRPNRLAAGVRDVTSAAAVRAAFDAVAAAFGGVDIVVSMPARPWQGRIGEVDEDIMRKSFELNFYGHQRVAQAAVKIMLTQATGGCLLFNVSKQAVNPGPNFGP